MEKAILKTLIYADCSDYPLKIYEIHKWLIGERASLREVEKTLKRLINKSKVKQFEDYLFLQGKSGVVAKRRSKLKQSEKFLKKAQIISFLLKLIPTVKLVGVSGGLAMGNASDKDDIDLFVITGKNRLWISRLLILGILSLTGQRRKASDSVKQAAGKLCLNTLVEEDKLEQNKKDIYLAHEVLQMKVLWQREGIYQRYLEANSWVFEFIPNWISDARLTIKDLPAGRQDLRLTGKNHQSSIINHQSLLDYIERLAKWFQLKIMQQPQGMERIEEGALYFHPNDYHLKILTLYKDKVKKLSTT